MRIEQIVYRKWISKNHPYFDNIWPIGVLLIIAFFIFGVVSIWALPAYWWKIMLTDICAGIIWWLFGSIANGIYTDEFIDEVKKKNRI